MATEPKVGVSEAILDRLERQVRDGMEPGRRASLVIRLVGIFPELGPSEPSALTALCEPPPDGQVCAEAIEDMRLMWRMCSTAKVSPKSNGKFVKLIEVLKHPDSVIALMKWVGSALTSERDR